MKKILMLTTALLFAGTAWAGEAINKMLDTRPDGLVSIKVPNGDVVVKGWKNNQVKVTGTIDDKATGYNFETSGGRTVFEIVMPQGKPGDSYTGKGSELEIMVPSQSETDFGGINTNVTADGIKGGSEIHVINGNIGIAGLAGDISVETVNGNIESKNLNGDIKLRTVNGDIHDTGSKGKLKVATVAGSITADTAAKKLHGSNVSADMNFALDKINDFKASTVSGDIDVSIKKLDKNASIKLNSVSGALKVNLPKSVSASLNVQANAGGSIINNFSKDPVVKHKYGPSQSLQFSLNEGGSEIDLSTISGRIELAANYENRDIASLPGFSGLEAIPEGKATVYVYAQDSEPFGKCHHVVFNRQFAGCLIGGGYLKLHADPGINLVYIREAGRRIQFRAKANTRRYFRFYHAGPDLGVIPTSGRTGEEWRYTEMREEGALKELKTLKQLD